MKLLLESTHLYSRPQVLSKPCPVPAEMGLCAWYFKEIPDIAPTDGCVVKDGIKLLYIGISQNIRERVKYHFRGNAEGSTLRLTLGVLLTGQSGFPLRVGRGKSMTFTHPGESLLNDWMEQNAFVCWMTHEKPSEVKAKIINRVSPPLNIEGNNHPFTARLKEMRGEAKRKAREVPISK